MAFHNDEKRILSEKHREILKHRLEFRIKTVTDKDIAVVRRDTLIKLEEIHSSMDFAVTMAQRIKLLYEILFDTGFSKSRSTKKTIAAGLLYFISPEDFLPDDIPGLGYLDDAYIINEVWEKVSFETKSYIKAKGKEYIFTE